LEIEKFYVSPGLAHNPRLEIVGPLQTMSFDEKGNLIGYHLCAKKGTSPPAYK
jgi:hypothetical protein